MMDFKKTILKKYTPSTYQDKEQLAEALAIVLFFDRKPASEKPWTRNLWIYDFRTNMHFTLKENSLKRSDLDEFVKCFNPKNRLKRKETERFKSYDYEELLKRDKLNYCHRQSQKFLHLRF